MIGTAILTILKVYLFVYSLFISIIFLAIAFIGLVYNNHAHACISLLKVAVFSVICVASLYINSIQSALIIGAITIFATSLIKKETNKL